MRIATTFIFMALSRLLLAQSADVSKGCAPLTVSFTAPAGSNTYYWDFKDGAVSNLKNPQNIFTTPGEYVVEFKKTANGPVEGTVKINVYPKPDPKIAADPSAGCRPLNIQFSDTTKLDPSILILSRNWVFGDGGSIANQKNPQYTYFSTGIYSVSLAYTTNYPSCNVTRIFTDFVKVGSKPTAAFNTTPGNLVACEPPLNVSFTNTTSGGSGNLTYSWDFDNGNTANVQNPPSQTYNANGTYRIKLIVSDAFGCSDSITRILKIGLPKVDFLVADTVCYRDSVQLINQSDAGAYNWNLGQGIYPYTSTLLSPYVVFEKGGLQTISLQVSSGANCSATLSKQIYVEQPDASFTVNPGSACTNPSVFTYQANADPSNQFAWTFHDGTVANGQNVSYTWYSPDTSGFDPFKVYRDTVYLQVTSARGCKADNRYINLIQIPNARFTADKLKGCAPLTVTFSDSSRAFAPISSWTWMYGDGSSPQVQATNAGVTHTFDVEGEYNVRLAIKTIDGCVDTSYQVTIQVGAPIAGEISFDKTKICPGDTVFFKYLSTDPRIDDWHISTDDHRLFHCSDDKNPFWVFNTEANTFPVSVTTIHNGCVNTVPSKDSIVVQGPVARLHYETTCNNTLQFHFKDESTGATAIHWTLGDGSTSTMADFNHLYNKGSYQVILQAENPNTQCPASFDTAIVYATQVKAVITFPDEICGDTEYNLDGSKSVDVNPTCYKGFTWYLSFDRPFTTNESLTPYTFGPSGPQTLWLAVEDINGCKDTVRKDFIIYNRKINFAMDDSLICLPGKVQFTDLSTSDANITSWTWNFGDGDSLQTKNAMHTYVNNPVGGQTFTVKLNVRDDKGCYGYAEKVISVYKPVSYISPQQAQICAGKSVLFNATEFKDGGSGLQWEWDFGNGLTGLGQSPASTFANGGVYIVRLKFTEIGSGCFGETTVPVTVQDYPIAAFSTNVDGKNIICYPQNIQFTNTSSSSSPLSTFWNLGNGSSADGSSASAVYGKGSYLVTMVSATSLGCADTIQRSFTLVGPEGNFNIDKPAICLGDAITFNLLDTVDVSSYSWSFGDGSTIKNTSPVTHPYNFLPPSGQVPVKLVLTGADAACTFIVEQPISISLIKADFIVQDSAQCLGLSHSFINNSVASDQWQWSFGDGSFSSNNSPSHSYVDEGNYTVTLISTDLPVGCKDTLSRQVSVYANPDIYAYGDSICAGDTALLRVFTINPQGNTYIWKPTQGLIPPVNNDFVQVTGINDTRTFTIEVIDQNGCRGFDTVQVFVPGPISLGSDLDTLVAPNAPVRLPIQVEPFYDYTFTPPLPLTDPIVVSSPDSNLTIKLRVRDELGCFTQNYLFKIRIYPDKVWAPNVFTPNNDALNNTFQLLSIGDRELVEVRSLKIYNRWGQKVFETSGNLKTAVWDGKQDGVESPVDVYYWVAEIRYYGGRQETRKGQISLIR